MGTYYIYLLHLKHLSDHVTFMVKDITFKEYINNNGKSKNMLLHNNI